MRSASHRAAGFHYAREQYARFAALIRPQSRYVTDLFFCRRLHSKSGYQSNGSLKRTLHLSVAASALSGYGGRTVSVAGGVASGFWINRGRLKRSASPVRPSLAPRISASVRTCAAGAGSAPPPPPPPPPPPRVRGSSGGCFQASIAKVGANPWPLSPDIAVLNIWCASASPNRRRAALRRPDGRKAHVSRPLIEIGSGFFGKRRCLAFAPSPNQPASMWSAFAPGCRVVLDDAEIDQHRAVERSVSARAMEPQTSEISTRG